MLSDLSWKRVRLKAQTSCSRCSHALLPGQTAYRVHRDHICQRCWTEARANHADLPMPALLRELGIGLPGAGPRKVAESIGRNPRRNAAEYSSSWSKGAAGEAAVGAYLDDQLKGTGVEILHARALPGSRSDFDHVTISAAGVTVVDSKNLKGDIEIVGWDAWASESHAAELHVNGRSADRLVRSVKSQIASLESVVADAGFDFSVPVHGALCFVNARGLARTSCRDVQGVHVNRVERMCDYVRRDGPLSEDQIVKVADYLHRSLEPR